MREGLELGFLKDLRGDFFEGVCWNLRALNLKGFKNLKCLQALNLKAFYKKLKHLRSLNLEAFKFKNSKTAVQRAFELKFHAASKAYE